MKSRISSISIRDLTKNVVSVERDENEDEIITPYGKARNREEFGVIAYNGKLTVRPAYQRNFVWNETQTKKFIESIKKKWAINPLTFSEESDGRYECVDGQQRTISLCDFIYNYIAAFNKNKFDYHSKEERDAFLDYKIPVTFIEYESDEEKIEHFTAINQPTTILTNQELRNAAFHGPFVEALKDYLGRKNCKLRAFMSDYFQTDDETVGRQTLIETAILFTLIINNEVIYAKLKKDTSKGTFGNDKNHSHHIDIDKDTDNEKYYHTAILDYMRTHRDDDNCDEVVYTIEKLVNWIKDTFGERKLHPDVDKKHWNILQNVKNWAYLFRTYGKITFNQDHMREELDALIMNEEIHWKHNIPEYLLIKESNPNMTIDEAETLANEMLNLSGFSETLKKEAFIEEEGRCHECHKQFKSLAELEAHHNIPFSQGGKSTRKNLVLLCPECHGRIHNYRKINKVSV